MPYASSLSSGMRSHTLLHALFYLALSYLALLFLCTRCALMVPSFPSMVRCCTVCVTPYTTTRTQPEP